MLKIYESRQRETERVKPAVTRLNRFTRVQEIVSTAGLSVVIIIIIHYIFVKDMYQISGGGWMRGKRGARTCANERGTWPGHGPLWVSVCMSTEQPTRPRVLII